MERLPTLLVGVFLLGFPACNTAQDEQLAIEAKLVSVAQPDTAKKSVDMKALFGEDYRPGDIGHAFGSIVSVADLPDNLTVDHGPIHGTPIEPATSQLRVLPDAKISVVSEGDRVEFLVKKGDDGIYRVSAMCRMNTDDEKCLDSILRR